ncbi:DUF3830 family protein [Rhodococcus rhodnii]|uniref:DUF3830 family protein n=1 Tax=Rhodococcus rhodnii TaxID=38312 RepID=A0A6P2CH37_9NOCA|nr:DUF3830 family protein [Rhodococcus rhodnii]TXG91682.1 DUF3830 family protein [Rhodococcus rhodnii]
MARYIDITLTRRGVTCVAKLLDAEAPRTCDAVWNSLPLGVNAFHAKYARNEIYTLVDAFADEEPGLENPTITPIPGDVMYFEFAPWQLTPSTHGYGDVDTPAQGKIDLAVFYGRNNLLLNADFGFVPGTVFATIVRGLDEIAEASNDLWLRGVEGEVLRFDRHDGEL